MLTRGIFTVGYHLLWSTTANITGTDEQKERIQKLIIENNYFVGGKTPVPDILLDFELTRICT
jgi:hypothetical protein